MKLEKQSTQAFSMGRLLRNLWPIYFFVAADGDEVGQIFESLVHNWLSCGLSYGQNVGGNSAAG
jgi:hypothetical protein